MSKIYNMRAIEYNFMMTILKLLNDRLPSIANEYGIRNTTIPILPAYPANLTDIEKPSIIVRKVDTDQYKVGIGNVLGQYYDPGLRGYVDVVGKCHKPLLQFDVVAGNNTDRLLYESIISDGIFNQISFNESGIIDFYDFITDIDNPQLVGNAKLIGDPTITDLDDTESTNNNYIGIIRHKFSIIQTVIPTQEYVDLSKWMKQTYKIKI